MINVTIKINELTRAPMPANMTIIDAKLDSGAAIVSFDLINSQFVFLAR
jgi:hypothetical protein